MTEIKGDELKYFIATVRAKRPTHPGHMIRYVLMPNSHLNEDNIADILKLPIEDTRILLEGKCRLTTDNSENLRVRFGEVASTLLRLQATGDFFDMHGRRPNPDEKDRLFALLPK